MIVDIPRFMAAERPYWDELRAILDRMDAEPERRMPLAEIQRLHIAAIIIVNGIQKTCEWLGAALLIPQ